MKQSLSIRAFSRKLWRRVIAEARRRKVTVGAMLETIVNDWFAAKERL